MLRDGQLGGGGGGRRGGGGGGASERKTKSPLGCVTTGAGRNGEEEAAVGVCLVTEMSPWQMHF